MQTVKTAAIVVLMMTVMYSAYISLTTPPEPLPTDVRDLVINDQGSLSIDGNLSDSLDAIGINTGTPSNAESVPISSIGSLQLPDSVATPASANAFVAGAATDLRSGNSTNLSFGATVGLPTPATESGITTRLTDMVPVESGSIESGPAVGDIAIASPPTYPNTNRTFQVPDPTQIDSSFGTSPAGMDLPKRDLVPTDLALASGTSASSPAAPPQSSVSQATALATPNRNGATDPALGSQQPNLGLANALRIADKQYAEDKREDALATLSIFYNTPDLSGEERADLLSRLDPLARDVIYSQRHLLEQPHRVGQNETLMEVAARYEVPWQLLANINQVQDPVTILPGTELKVVRGPFRAEVNLSTNELTLFLGDLYAGRFPIGVGADPAPKPGTFTIQDKQTERTYYNRAGSPVPPGTPGNPYGNIWLDLGGQLCIHGSPSTTSPTDKGCISLAADFADDLYGILSQGSSVTIRR